jgi:hypothetical protein
VAPIPLFIVVIFSLQEGEFINKVIFFILVNFCFSMVFQLVFVKVRLPKLIMYAFDCLKTLLFVEKTISALI